MNLAFAIMQALYCLYTMRDVEMGTVVGKIKITSVFLYSR